MASVIQITYAILKIVNSALITMELLNAHYVQMITHYKMLLEESHASEKLKELTIAFQPIQPEQIAKFATSITITLTEAALGHHSTLDHTQDLICK